MLDWQPESFLSFSVKTAEKGVCVTLTLTRGENCSGVYHGKEKKIGFKKKREKND